MRHIIIPAIFLFALITVSPFTADGWIIPAHDVAELGGFEGDNARLVLAGHTPGVFSGLADLEGGDWILITSSQGTERYYVLWSKYHGDNTVWWPDAETRADLLIITCEGDGRRFVGAIRAE